MLTSFQNIYKTHSVSTNKPLHFHTPATRSAANKHVQTANKTTKGMYNKQGYTDHKK